MIEYFGGLMIEYFGGLMIALWCCGGLFSSMIESHQIMTFLASKVKVKNFVTTSPGLEVFPSNLFEHAAW